MNFGLFRGEDIFAISLENALCFKNKATVSQQQMGNLPMCRQTSSRPFINTGMDFAGPVLIASKKGRGAKHLKHYTAIYVCMSTKAIHLELVTDLSFDAFIASFKRFVSRRGLPANLYSDNGSNFIGGSRNFKETHHYLLNQCNNFASQEYQTENNIIWHFIPASAQNFGGLWEAAVKSMKSFLLKYTYNSYLTYDEMYTLLTNIEAILNSRPLCAASEDDSSYEALTPGHFLIGAPIVSLPEKTLNEEKRCYNRWQQIQIRSQSFWKRFYSEYFNQLQNRNKWIHKKPNLEVNDIVLIKEDNTPSCKWPLGKIVELHPGKDELIRVVAVKTKNSIIKRPVSKIAKLPFN